MATYTRKRELIGAEDVNQGTSTFSRTTSTGGSQTMSQVNLDSLRQFKTNTVTSAAGAATFNAALGSVQKITLSENTTATVTNPAAGQPVVFWIVQHATAAKTFSWPTNVKGGDTVGTTLSGNNFQLFIGDGTNLYAVADMQTNL